MKRRISIKKIIKFCLILFLSIFSIIILLELYNKNKEITSVDKIEKENKEEKEEKKTQVVEEEVVEVQYVYDSNMPSSADQLILEYAFNTKFDSEGNVIEEKIPSLVKVGTGQQAIYTGRMTAYGGDCSGCSGTVSCKTKSGNKYNLKENGHIYVDDQYGQVRIIAAPLSLFSCGTILKVESETLEPFYAVVLDTGYSVKNAWNGGEIWIDLAFQTQNDPSITSVNSKNVTYKVQRWGWE